MSKSTQVNQDITKEQSEECLLLHSAWNDLTKVWTLPVIHALGLKEPAIHRVLRDCYALLGLISFFTVGDDEVRAWPIPDATRAQDAAGTVHSDIGRGFIRAEVTAYDDLVAANGSFPEVGKRGRLRLEGKDYPVRDGEICHFRFNVGK